MMLEKTSLDLSKTLTISVNNGGAVSFEIHDALEFIYTKKLKNEIEFLSYLLQTKALDQNSLESFLKHLFYKKESARLFTQWQREIHLILYSKVL